MAHYRTRIATHKDIPKIVELGRMFFEATILPRYVAYDGLSMAMTTSEMIDALDSVCFVLERDGEVIGGIGGKAVPMYFNLEAVTAQQVFYFVNPAFRSRESVTLLREFKRWGREYGAKMIATGAKRDANHDRMEKFLTRDGFEPLETILIEGV